MIQLQNIYKHFPSKKNALENINIEISDRGIVAIVGENGAGKTTIFRLIGSLIKPSDGRVIVNGRDVSEYRSNVMSRIGFVFGSEHNLYDRLTARENIRYFGKLHGIKKDKVDSIIKNLSSLLTMDDFLDKRMSTFSTGMKQKTAIVRALVHDPDIFILDEPTSGIDPVSSDVIRKFLVEYSASGKLVILSSHNIPEIEEISDRVIIIHKGRLHFDDNTQSIKSNGNSLKNIYFDIVREK